MEIIINTEPGNIYDFFNTLWVLNNYEYSQKIAKDLNVDKNSEFDNAIEKVFRMDIFNRSKVQKYFPRDLEANTFLNMDSIWEHKKLSDYIKYLTNLSDEDVKNNLVRIICKLLDIEKCSDEIIKIGTTKDEILEYIQNKKIDSKIKWEIFCILSDSKSYIERFIEDIKEYMETYRELMKKREESLQDFNAEIEMKIKKHGTKFLKEVTNNGFNFEVFERIYITTSIDIGLYIKSFHDKKTCYVVVGPRIKEILKNMGGENELEKNIAIFKNYSDQTKFNILSLLMEREYYAIEIGERLGLSKVNVSRNVKHLMLAGLISMKKVGQKTYYSLNKNIMVDNVEFIIKKFDLYEYM